MDVDEILANVDEHLGQSVRIEGYWVNIPLKAERMLSVPPEASKWYLASQRMIDQLDCSQAIEFPRGEWRRGRSLFTDEDLSSRTQERERKQEAFFALFRDGRLGVTEEQARRSYHRLRLNCGLEEDLEVFARTNTLEKMLTAEATEPLLWIENPTDHLHLLDSNDIFPGYAIGVIDKSSTGSLFVSHPDLIVQFGNNRDVYLSASPTTAEDLFKDIGQSYTIEELRASPNAFIDSAVCIRALFTLTGREQYLASNIGLLLEDPRNRSVLLRDPNVYKAIDKGGFISWGSHYLRIDPVYIVGEMKRALPEEAPFQLAMENVSRVIDQPARHVVFHRRFV